MSLAAVAELLPCLPSCRSVGFCLHCHALYQLTAPITGMLLLSRCLTCWQSMHAPAQLAQGALVCWTASALQPSAVKQPKSPSSKTGITCYRLRLQRSPAARFWALLHLLAALLAASLPFPCSSAWTPRCSLLCALLQLLAGRPRFSLTDCLALFCRGSLQLCFGRCCSCWLHPLRRYQEIFNTEAWSSAIKVGNSKAIVAAPFKSGLHAASPFWRATILGYDCDCIGLLFS